MNILNKFRRLAKWVHLLRNWHLKILEHYGFIQGQDVIYQLRNGLSLKMKAGRQNSDSLILWDIYINRPYTQHDFRIKKDDIVVDIGAHIGIFTTYAALHSKEVYAYEPVPSTFSYLVENVKLNKFSNVFLYNYAVSDRHKKLPIYMAKGSSGSHSAYKTETKTDEFIEVNVISLEDILSENKLKGVDFLKLDCEGSEYDIIFGASSEVLARVKKMAIELHPRKDQSEDKSKQFLSENGFTLTFPRRHIVYASREE